MGIIAVPVGAVVVAVSVPGLHHHSNAGVDTTIPECVGATVYVTEPPPYVRVCPTPP
jgi:hypothetical protein